MTAPERIAPGSLADKIRTASPARVGGTLASIIAETREHPSYVMDEVERLCELGYLERRATMRGTRFFWQGPESKPQVTL